MDELLHGADELKIIHSSFVNHLKASQTDETSEAGIDTLIDEYLADFASDVLPEELDKALFIGE